MQTNRLSFLENVKHPHHPQNAKEVEEVNEGVRNKLTQRQIRKLARYPKARVLRTGNLDRMYEVCIGAL